MVGTLTALFFSGLLAGLLPGQSTESGEPAAESGASAPASRPDTRDDTHILGVVPNYTAVNNPLAVYKPIPVSEKYRIAMHDSLDPFCWVVSGVYAGIAQWHQQYPGYGMGAQGYAKRYGAAFADGAINTYLTEAILPSMLHQDPRYFRLGQGSGWKRAGYAMSRVLLTRADSGRTQFNYSEIAGTLASAGISNLYYPSSDRSAGDTMERFAVGVVSDAGFNVLKEFWPDMRRKLLHR
jgi:hypothetical protein